jgi:hypothetical protein
MPSAAAAAEAIAKAAKKAKQAELSEECTYPRGIIYPKWPEFDSSIKFVENDPAYADGNVRALAWRKVWKAIKEHFEAARDEDTHSPHNSTMKIRISTLDKPKAADACHLFYDAMVRHSFLKWGRDGAEGEDWSRGRRQAVTLPLDQGKAGRPTQTRKRSRESPAMTMRRTQQQEHLVTPTQAPRPAPDISKKMRPKNGDKEGR